MQFSAADGTYGIHGDVNSVESQISSHIQMLLFYSLVLPWALPALLILWGSGRGLPGYVVVGGYDVKSYCTLNTSSNVQLD